MVSELRKCLKFGWLMLGIPFSGPLLASSILVAPPTDLDGIETLGLVTDHLTSTLGPDEIEAMLLKLPSELTAEEQAYVFAIADTTSNDIILDVVEAEAREGLQLEAQMRAQETLNLLIAAESAKKGIDLSAEETTDEEKAEVLAAVSAGLEANQSSSHTAEILDLLGSEHGGGREFASSDVSRLMQGYVEKHASSIEQIKTSADLYRNSESGESLSSSEILARGATGPSSTSSGSFGELNFPAKDFDLSNLSRPQSFNGNPTLASLGGIENTLFDSSFDPSAYVPEQLVQNSASGQIQTFSRDGQRFVVEDDSNATTTASTGGANAHDGSVSVDSSGARNFEPVSQSGVEGSAERQVASSSGDRSNSGNSQPDETSDDATRLAASGSANSAHPDAGYSVNASTEDGVGAASTEPEIRKAIPVEDSAFRAVDANNQIVKEPVDVTDQLNAGIEAQAGNATHVYVEDPFDVENLKVTVPNSPSVNSVTDISQVPSGFRGTYGQLASFNTKAEKDAYILEQYNKALVSTAPASRHVESPSQNTPEAPLQRSVVTAEDSAPARAPSAEVVSDVPAKLDMGVCRGQVMNEVVQLIGASDTFQLAAYRQPSSAYGAANGAGGNLFLESEVTMIRDTSVDRIFQNQDLVDKFCSGLQSPEGITARDLNQSRSDFLKIIADASQPFAEKIDPSIAPDVENFQTFDVDALVARADEQIPQFSETDFSLTAAANNPLFGDPDVGAAFGGDLTLADAARLASQPANFDANTLDGVHHSLKKQSELYAKAAEESGDERVSSSRACFEQVTSRFMGSVNGSFDMSHGADWWEFKFNLSEALTQGLAQRDPKRYPDLCDSLTKISEAGIHTTRQLEDYLKAHPEESRPKLFSAFSLMHYEVLKAYQSALNLPSDCDSSDALVKKKREMVEAKAKYLFSGITQVEYFKGVSAAINGDESAGRQRLTCLRAEALVTESERIIARSENPQDELALAMKSLERNFAKARSGVPIVSTELPADGGVRSPAAEKHASAPADGL